MKKILIILTVGLLICSCKKENRTDYNINGKAEGVYNGIRVYLKEIDQKGKEVVIDTAIVMNETFSFNGNVLEPNLHSLSIDGENGKVVFMLENADISIEIDKQRLDKSTIIGSKSQDDFSTFQTNIRAIQEQGTEIMAKHRDVLMEQSSSQSDSLREILNTLREKMTNYPLEYIKENNDSYFSLELFKTELSRPKADAKKLVDVFDNFSTNIKSTDKAKKVKILLDELYKEYERVAYLEVGNPAPNFEAPTTNGDTLSLNAIKGKVTIIDFWAAWCGPCRRENPNVVKIYNEYHNKGLEIIGVSLDGQTRQKDPKNAWLEAIKKDNLTWHHVSNLKYFNDPVAQLYNIKAIPATFILDSEGTIVAKNLRGKALEDKVKELLEKS
ncbi:TlpA disulfide reductase family protein [uncultured Winogradskyella sp.]|uniref:TlpA disulfide reductase family protein n=1 Tax=uncultured Winogradskyella sp. TaxID=395353 RepID=UPI002625D990|nr:TlpA disulfide reductase family protein [uncultured Winogradskyella sp.]